MDESKRERGKIEPKDVSVVHGQHVRVQKRVPIVSARVHEGLRSNKSNFCVASLLRSLFLGIQERFCLQVYFFLIPGVSRQFAYCGYAQKGKFCSEDGGFGKGMSLHQGHIG